MSAQRPLELILARNLLSSLSTPGLLVGEGGSLLFYNEAAGAIIGRSFEDATGLTADEWTSEFGPLDADGEPIAYDQIQATQTLRAHMPFHGEFSIKTTSGRREIALTAIPIVAPDESTAAVVLFWPTDGEPVHAHAAHLSDHAHEHDHGGGAPRNGTAA
jgi:PAS domain-containing protein